ncbi:hypothetical protein MKX01_010872 [Papaver californicum]|nr:hypothetical protein MKX01_010872 [Papaver californicum]
MKNMTDPVDKDGVVDNLYQLVCGLPMPKDYLLVHSLMRVGLQLKRVLSILNTYLRFIFLTDVQKFIVPSCRQVPGFSWKIFPCDWKLKYVRIWLDGFPTCYRGWDKHFYRFLR